MNFQPVYLNKRRILISLSFSLLLFCATRAQTDTRIYDIIDAVSADRIRQDVKTLADFGTRHTLSDTVSQTRGYRSRPKVD